MTFPSRPSWPRRLDCGALISLLLAGTAFACGPDFPETYYDMDGRQLLAAPEGYFAVEIARISREIVPAQRAIVTARENFAAANADADDVELTRALAERGISRNGSWEFTYGLRELRRRLEEAKKAENWAAVPEIANDLPAGMPVEFATYFRGAENWERGKIPEAREQWRALLQLPERDRRYRSTWAAFMLGRAWLAEAEAETASDPKVAREEAIKYFRQVRALVAAGFPDSTGLAVASLGWEARMELSRQAFGPAIHLYLEQDAAGDPTASESLRRTAAQLADLPDAELGRLATDALVRRVFTSYLVARGGMNYDGSPEPGVVEKLAQRWAVVLKAAGVREVVEADRLAWLAYEGGLFALARDWAGLAPAASPEAEWIRAKLALQGGDLAAGARFMRSALAGPTLIDLHRVRLEAELGRVCLAQDDFAGALNAWLDGGHEEDAAFVAERVMTAQELTQFVDQHDEVWTAATSPAVQRAAQFTRHLLARRLARLGKTDQALRYYPAQYREPFALYAEAVRAGFDSKRSATDRARSFWTAAKSMRENGMDFIATELEPDWAIYYGGYESSPTTEQRMGAPALAGGVFAPTPLEASRLHDQRAPEKRFHYRYRAAELAWWAASLLPNESDETANILNEAGGWLKARDPEAAKPFYQALVIRCGQTELGRAATERRWFPVGPVENISNEAKSL